jgi:hypothetical protein
MYARGRRIDPTGREQDLQNGRISTSWSRVHTTDPAIPRILFFCPYGKIKGPREYLHLIQREWANGFRRYYNNLAGRRSHEERLGM